MKKDNWIYHVKVHSPRMNNTIIGMIDTHVIESWLMDNIGRKGNKWQVFAYYISHVNYFFKTEEDAVYFALRWSS